MTNHEVSRFHKPRKLTKKARKELVRQIIDRYDHYVVFDGEDTNAFNELTGAEHTFIRREHNPIYPTDVRYMTVSDCGRVWSGWSWNKAIDGWKGDSPQIVARACRLAVIDQTEGFRVKAPQECVECGQIYDLAIDHHNPAFSAILKHFLDTHGDIELKAGPCGIGRVIACDEVLKKWQDFHEEHATYQILCRSCNSRKGAR